MCVFVFCVIYISKLVVLVVGAVDKWKKTVKQLQVSEKISVYIVLLKMLITLWIKPGSVLISC